LLGLGLFLAVTGVCSIGLGVVLKKGEATDQGKKKKKKKKKEGQSPPPNPTGFFIGGAVFILAGLGFVVGAMMK
jgi:hypothetical protein